MAGKQKSGFKADSTNSKPPVSYCEGTECTNIARCTSQGLATFSVLGDICTRHCNHFCRAKSGTPLPPDPGEPAVVASKINELKLKHVVLISPTRDDLSDGGASILAKTITLIHELNPETSVEVVLHNILAGKKAIKTIVESNPEVICHAVKTVPRLNDELFDSVGYKQSIEFLEDVKSTNPSIVTKSSLWLGLGENEYEVIQVLEDVHSSGCSCITLGQYMPAVNRNNKISRYVTPEEFVEYQNLSMQIGYSSVRAGRFVRASYDALEMYRELAQ